MGQGRVIKIIRKILVPMKQFLPCNIFYSITSLADRLLPVAVNVNFCKESKPHDVPFLVSGLCEDSFCASAIPSSMTVSSMREEAEEEFFA